MSTQDDLWLWFIDDAPLQALLKAEGELGTMRMRAASSPGLVRAMTAHMEGRATEAVDELRSAIDAGETQPEAFLFLGQIHFEAKRLEEALAVYRQLLAVDPNSALGAFNAGVCLERLSRWTESAEMLRRAVRLDPARREAWLGLGLASLHQRRAEEALQAFDHFLETDPESEPALFGRAVALQMLRRFDEASAIYQRFRSTGEPTGELLTNLLALAVARKDDPAELDRVAADLARLRPGTRQAAESQAYAAIVSADWQQAVAHLTRLGEAEALPEDWAYALAYALWRCGDAEAASRHVDALLVRRPQHFAALFLRAVLLEDDGSNPEALIAYRKASAESPESDAALWNLARIAAAESKADVCRQAADTLLEHNRNSAEGWYATGLAALLEQDPQAGAKAFSEALRLRGDWPEAEWNLGLCLLDAADPAKAESILQRAYPQVQNDVTPGPLVRASLENGRPERALELLDAAPAFTPAPALIYNLALAFHTSAKLDAAERLYRRVIDSGARFADAHVNLGHVLLAAGRPADAEQLWKQAAEIEAAA